MKHKHLLLYFTFFLVAFSFNVNEVKACHAIALVNYTQQNPVAGGIQVTAASDSPTCGCTEYWLDIEVRCMNEPFNGAPFSPGFYGPLNTYPFFQSGQMLKPSCVVQNYPWTTIPYAGLCPGISYQYRMRENHNGQAGPWTPTQTFTVPGVAVPLTGTITANTTTICLGNCANLTASVTGGCNLALTYTWNNGLGTGSTKTVCPTVTTTYTVTINEACSNMQTTQSITITVVPPAVAGTATVAPNPVCLGSPVTLTLSGSAGNVQWQQSTNGGGSWTNIAGATTTTFNTAPLMVNTCFRAEVTGCNGVLFSNMVCVTINPAPIIDPIANIIVCHGNNIPTSNYTSSTAGATFTWTNDNTAIGLGASGTGNIAAFTGTNTTANPITAIVSVTGTFGGCVGPATTYTITVNPNPVFTISFTNPTTCGGTDGTITLSGLNPGASYTVSYNGGVAVTMTANAMGDVIITGLAAGLYTNFVVTLNGCTTTDNSTITLTDPNPPTVGAGANQTVCEGTAATLTASNPDGATITWDNGVTDGVAYTPAVGTLTYTVTANLANCISTDQVDVTVNPNPTATVPANITLCHAATVPATNFTASIAGSTFTWTNDNTGIGLGANGAGDIAAFTATNTTANPITATITVTPTANGCVGTPSTYTITVHPLPTPNFTFSNVCFGTTTSFTDLSLSNGGTITNWNWDFTNNGTVDNTTQNPTNGYPSAANYTVELMVQTALGCKDSITKVVTVNPIPVANFSATDVCLNTITSFSNSSTVTTGTIQSYFWDFANGSGTDTLLSTTYLYTAANTYNVSLTVTSDSGCIHTVVKPVVVFNNPIAAFTTADVCQNLVAQFTDQSNNNGATINQWNWDIDFDGVNHTTDYTSINATNNYATANTYTVELIVTTTNGCSDTISNPITMHPMPNAIYTFTNECFGTAIDFVDNSTVSSGNIATWNWNLGNTNTSILQNPSEMYAIDGQYNVTLIVTTDHNCKDTLTQTVTVYPLPVVDFTPTEVCLLETTLFNDLSVVSSGSNVGWNWNFDDGTTSNLKNPTHNYSLEGVFQVKLIVTTNYGCIDSITKPVTVNPLPQVNFTTNAIDSCSPVIVDFTDLSVINTPGNNVIWQWNFGDAGSSTQQNPNAISFTNSSHTSVASYGISLTVISDKGCVGKDSIANMINSYPIPTASFTYGPAPTNIYDSEISFTDNSIIASRWLWDLGDGASSTEQNPVHLYADSGLYTVILYMENIYGCEDTTEKIIKIDPVFVIWIPNTFTPDGDNVNDFFYAEGYGIKVIETLIFDRWGEKVFEGYQLDSKWDGVDKRNVAKTEVYSYKIRAKDVFGQWHEYIGHVNLLR